MRPPFGSLILNRGENGECQINFWLIALVGRDQLDRISD